jgi:CheY-like chemotaxis protein
MINQKIIIRLLKSLGCEVVACDDGADCVELLSSLPKPEPLAPAFDLCLMDLEMYAPFLPKSTQTQTENVLFLARTPGPN